MAAFSPLTREEALKYESLFQRYDGSQSGCLSYTVAMDIFKQSGLSHAILLQIVNLAQGTSSFSSTSFCIAMHTIVCHSKRQMAIPTSLLQQDFPTLTLPQSKENMSMSMSSSDKNTTMDKLNEMIILSSMIKKGQMEELGKWRMEKCPIQMDPLQFLMTQKGVVDGEITDLKNKIHNVPTMNDDGEKKGEELLGLLRELQKVQQTTRALRKNKNDVQMKLNTQWKENITICRNEIEDARAQAQAVNALPQHLPSSESPASASSSAFDAFSTIATPGNRSSVCSITGSENTFDAFSSEEPQHRHSAPDIPSSSRPELNVFDAFSSPPTALNIKSAFPSPSPKRRTSADSFADFPSPKPRRRSSENAFANFSPPPADASSPDAFTFASSTSMEESSVNALGVGKNAENPFADFADTSTIPQLSPSLGGFSDFASDFPSSIGASPFPASSSTSSLQPSPSASTSAFGDFTSLTPSTPMGNAFADFATTPDQKTSSDGNAFADFPSDDFEQRSSMTDAFSNFATAPSGNSSRSASFHFNASSSASSAYGTAPTDALRSASFHAEPSSSLEDMFGDFSVKDASVSTPPVTAPSNSKAVNDAFASFDAFSTPSSAPGALTPPAADDAFPVEFAAFNTTSPAKLSDTLDFAAFD